MDIRTFIGDRSFYKKVFTIAVPIMIQNGITNFVALLDNIMVGQLGTAQMSGTAVINQLLFVFNLCIFGILAGPGIYGAQFFGKGEILLFCIAAVHAAQNLGTSGLKRQMKMMTDLFTFCHCFDQFIRKILRMRSHKTNSL